MSTVRALIASSFAQRALGLLTRSRLHARAGVWFDRCSTVHSMGMRMPIDLVFLDAGFRIVDLRTNWGATQIARCRAATSVLEVAGGALARLQWRVGDRLRFGEPKSIPRQIATWCSVTLSLDHLNGERDAKKHPCGSISRQNLMARLCPNRLGKFSGGSSRAGPVAVLLGRAD
jgi:uncharacterized membrane protein (UPF0127 family)